MKDPPCRRRDPGEKRSVSISRKTAPGEASFINPEGGRACALPSFCMPKTADDKAVTGSRQKKLFSDASIYAILIQLDFDFGDVDLWNCAI